MLKFIALIPLIFISAQCRKVPKSEVKEKISDNERRFLEDLEIKDRVYTNLPKKGIIEKDLWHAYYWPYGQQSIKAKLFDSPKSTYDKLGELYRIRGKADVFDGQFKNWLDISIDWDGSQDWAGLCTGMADGAYLVEIPDYPLKLDGITFFPYELKAIAGLLLHRMQIERYFAGERAKLPASDIDRDGRPVRFSDRDTNPGSFHLALTTLIAAQKPVILDVNYLKVVLNFAVKGFQVQQDENISDSAKIEQLKALNPDAKSWKLVKTRVFMADSHRVSYQITGKNYDYVQDYEYILELDDKNEIIGGEWQGDSVTQHPDYLYTFDPKKVNWQQADMRDEFNKVVLPELGKILNEIISTGSKTNEILPGMNESHADYSRGVKAVHVHLPTEPAAAWGEFAKKKAK